MKSSSPSTATGKKQVPYVRKRDHPQFDGIRRSDSTVPLQKNKHNPLEDVVNSSLSRSLSDIWEFESKQKTPVVMENVIMKSVKEDFNEDIKLGDAKPIDKEDIETLSGSKKNINVHKIYLPQCAASYYKGNLPQNEVSVLCKSMDKLNWYLKSSKDEIRAGVPGRYLHAVMSQEIKDVGCFVGTIMYAFYLSGTRKNNQVCTVPIISMKRVDLSTHSEIKWLIKSCGMDESNLVFVDEVNLSYHDQFGNLKIVLVNGNKLPGKQEGLKDVVVEIFHCKEVDLQYPSVEEITMAEDCSCCTLLAEMFIETTPEILAGQGFSRLLLSGILLDTENLSNASCTSKDKYMTTLLLKGAGRFGCNGLYELLKHKMHDISDLKVREILRREFKKWTRVAGKPNSTGSRLTISHIGMSSIGISLEELLTHENSAVEELIRYQESEKLQLFMIVSGYHDDQKNFKREILVSAKTAELMRNFHHFFDINGTHLPLKALEQLGSKEELRAFDINNKLISRRSIERLLEEFSGIVKKN